MAADQGRRAAAAAAEFIRVQEHAHRVCVLWRQGEVGKNEGEPIEKLRDLRLRSVCALIAAARELARWATYYRLNRRTADILATTDSAERLAFGAWGAVHDMAHECRPLAREVADAAQFEIELEVLQPDPPPDDITWKAMVMQRERLQSKAAQFRQNPQRRPSEAKKELSDMAILVLRALPSISMPALRTLRDIAAKVATSPQPSEASMSRAVKALREHSLVDSASYRRTKAGDDEADRLP